MNILIISEYAYPTIAGTEVHIKDLGIFLSKNGDKVVVLSPEFGKEKSSSIKISPSFLIRKIRIPFVYLQAGSGPSVFGRIIFFFFATLYGIVKYNPQIVHSIYTLTPAVGSILATRLLRRPVIVSIWATEIIDQIKIPSLRNKIVHHILRNADKLLVLTNIHKKMLEKLVYPSEKIGITYNWVDLDIFRKKPKYCDFIRQKYNINEWEKIILFVGRLSKDKGLDILIKSVARLIHVHAIKAKLIVIGHSVSWPQEPFKELAKQRKIENEVIFVPVLNRDDLVKYYNGCDVFCLPSIISEGFGIVFAEAMACEIPVIGTDTGGVPEVIGDAGVIVPVNDINRLTEALKKVLTDAKLNATLRKKGFKRVNKKFEKNKILVRYRENYKECLWH